MPKFQVLVMSEPTEGNEDEFNDWYENTHLDEVISSTGWSRAQRFGLAAQAGLECPRTYLAAYEAEAEDAEAVLRRLNETRDQRQQSRAINMRTAGVWIFEELGPAHTA